MLLLFSTAALATEYTDTVGLNESSVRIDGAWGANFYLAEHDVRLTGVALYGSESDSSCTSCTVDMYLWTDDGSGTWHGSLLGSISVRSTADWYSLSVTTPVNLVSGTNYGIGFHTTRTVSAKYGTSSPDSATDTVWADALGYADGTWSSTDLSGGLGIVNDPGFYMKITVEANDGDRDGYDSVTDCDDDDANAYPGAEEIWYNDVDEACDEGDDFDQDGDGHQSDAYGGDDCDDEHEAARPDGRETWYDGIDGDCSGTSDYDMDGDGDDSADYGGGDCDDEDPAMNSTVEESWYDGVDQNCDGADDYDQDGDGHTTPSVGGDDCDDTDPRLTTDCSGGGGEDTGDTDTDDGGLLGGGGDTDGEDEKGGCLCMVTSSAPLAWGAVAGLVALARRRRQS